MFRAFMNRKPVFAAYFALMFALAAFYWARVLATEQRQLIAIASVLMMVLAAMMARIVIRRLAQ